MAYTIYNNDGTVLSTIAVGDVDSYSTSLDLIGKNVNNYGEYYNNNLVRLLTSFASPGTEEPRSPQTGQLWFNKTTKRLTVYDGSSFQPTYGSHVSGTAPVTTSTGDFWYDTVNSQLKVWDGNSYNLVGPSASGLLGTFGILPAPGPIRDGYSQVTQKASLINSYGSYIGMITTSSFNMAASSSTIYLAGTPRANTTASIVRGVTLFQNLDVLGSLSVLGDITINGWNVKSHPNTDLTAYYNITPYGSYTSTNTTTNLVAYNDANRAIATDLAKMFSTATYIANSTASVVCVYNTTTSVRKFYLTNLYGYVWWEPLNGYVYTTATSSWLWSTSTSLNIVP